MMRVLHTVSGLAPEAGGPSRSVPCLCRAMAAVGVETCLLSGSVAPGQAANLEPGRLVTVTGSGYVRACRDTARIGQEFAPDLIHVHALWAPSNHAAVRYAAKSRIPVILSTRGMLDPWALRQKPLKKRLALWLYQRGDLLSARCFHATAMQEAMNIRAQGLSQPITVIPNGVDLPDVMPVRSPRADGQKTALFLSRLHPGKGLLDLVAAWGQLRPDGWRMRIVGPDVCGHKAVVQKEIQRVGLQDVFEFVGEMDDATKWQAYVDADLFIHPSHSENFGISVVEALATGLPVITTKGTPWAELLGNSESSEVLKCESAKGEEMARPQLTGGSQRTENQEEDNLRTLEISNSITSSGRCGWWIDIGIEPLAKGLREAIGLSDDDRRTMGENGRRLVEVKYTWPAIAMQMKAIYEWVLNGGSVPTNVHQ